MHAGIELSSHLQYANKFAVSIAHMASDFQTLLSVSRSLS